MKFESKCGVGEYVLIDANKPDTGHARKHLDEVALVLAVQFSLTGETEYLVERYTTTREVMRYMVTENRLTPDPDFDQELGCYPPEQEQSE